MRSFATLIPRTRRDKGPVLAEWPGKRLWLAYCPPIDIFAQGQTRRESAGISTRTTSLAQGNNNCESIEYQYDNHLLGEKLTREAVAMLDIMKKIRLSP